MKLLAAVLNESVSFRRLKKRVASGAESVGVSGLHGAAHAYLLANLGNALPKGVSLLCIFPTQTEARKTYHDLFAFGAERVGFFPLLPDVLGEGSADSRKSLRAERIEALAILLEGGIVVTSVHAVCQRIPPLAAFTEGTFELKRGEELDFRELPHRLVRGGYHRVETVELKGEFAIRGGILDVFPVTRERPLRVEFFGDQIESIREFDETTQRSVKSLDRATLLPAKEFLLTEEARKRWLQRTEERYAEAPSTRLRSAIDALTDRLFETGTLPDVETYYPFLFPGSGSLLDAVPDGGRLYLNEPKWMEREMIRFAEKYNRLAEDARNAGQLWVQAEEAFLPFDALSETTRRFPKVISASSQREGADIVFYTEPLVAQKGNLQKFLDGLKEWKEKDYRIAIFSESENASLQMREILEDHALLSPTISFSVGSISEGFASEEWRLVVLSQEEIFGQHPIRHRQTRFRDGKPLLSLFDLQEGDYVVHVTHGIARYRGIKRLRVEGVEYDFLALQYDGGDMLYVPTHHIHLVQKYIGGGEEKGPSLDRLGGTSWNLRKARVQRSVEALAKELLALYAARQTAKGHAFSPDTVWQREFEAAFPFEETPDQYRAIEEVKRDMELPRPMDRLLCGDVGYGKTEVALRAAFKAVMDAKQVAVLVPTTVLAQQHYYTFLERMHEYPVHVRLLSRFASPKEMATTLRMLADGTCDIVVGTHRLLSADVKFRDLGLLIVDEEHRFGVKHKERLKQLRRQVDVLTMTATPIPRTLHMALTGIRDLSVIHTPPENRLPIETYVMEYNPEVVRQAILRELSRGGQVYFVHNRVESIESVAESLRQLVPQARIEVAHGQMSERALESVMMRFVKGEFDVLACTTIIESGLDIPNVNTILINRADAFGLAQLYQLRGRVGRSDRKAYGYLFYPEDRAMTEQSQKRLRVIEEFTELGSGFKIALRDMEIRGVGNLLGPEQHGHIAAVGYDLYCKLLEKAIAEQKGEPVEEEVETQIRLPVSAYLPEDYVAEATAKVALYKRIATIRSRHDRRELEAEMRDRYGPLPEPARNLLNIALLKALASHLGIVSVTYAEGRVVFSVDEKRSRLDPERVVALVREFPEVRLTPPARFSVPAKGDMSSASLEMLFHILGKLGAENPSDEKNPFNEEVSTQ